MWKNMENYEFIELWQNFVVREPHVVPIHSLTHTSSRIWIYKFKKWITMASQYIQVENKHKYDNKSNNNKQQKSYFHTFVGWQAGCCWLGYEGRPLLLLILSRILQLQPKRLSEFTNIVQMWKIAWPCGWLGSWLDGCLLTLVQKYVSTLGEVELRMILD